MKITKHPIVLFFFSVTFSLNAAGLSVFACEGEEHAAELKASGKPTFVLSSQKADRAVFQITGMSCQSCEKAITASLKKVQGVQGVSFRKSAKGEKGRIAEVLLAHGVKVDPTQLLQAVEKAGYSATVVD